MIYLTRSQWGAVASSGTGNALSPSPLGVAIHWEGPKIGSRPHIECGALVRGIQRFHMETRGWADIAYNLLVCEHGVIFEGRGKGRGSAANGTTAANLAFYAICALVGQGDPLTPAMITGLVEASRLCRIWGAGSKVTGHRDHYTTACPGDALYTEVKRGTFGEHAVPATPPVKPPAPSASKAPIFPLPRGWYFGPSTGPAASVSGYHGYRHELTVWQGQMRKRGWNISTDGLYGPQTAAVTRAFQKEKGIHVDGLIGAQTWAAAWDAKIS